MLQNVTLFYYLWQSITKCHNATLKSIHLLLLLMYSNYVNVTQNVTKCHKTVTKISQNVTKCHKNVTFCLCSASSSGWSFLRPDDLLGRPTSPWCDRIWPGVVTCGWSWGRTHGISEKIKWPFILFKFTLIMWHNL